MRKEIELWVYDMNFNRLGIIDTYEDALAVTDYREHSEFTLDVEADANIAELLLVDADRILVKSNDIHRGYYVELAQYTDDSKVDLHVEGRSLSVMTAWRTIMGQMRFAGNIENVMQQFVMYNCISPANPNRIIPNLVIGNNSGIDINVDETYVNYPLDLALWEICKKYDVSFEILMHHELKKYVFSVFQGDDRSALQDVLPHVIFAKAFDNVDSQSYTDEKADYKNTAIIEGENVNLSVNDDISGFNRRELYIDAKNISKTYKNENDVEVTMTNAEYEATLRDTGNRSLAEHPRIRSFESQINADAQNVYGVDFFIGDKITNRNDELQVVTHSRVIKATERWNKSGYSLALDFGTSVPTLLQKIKREVK